MCDVEVLAGGPGRRCEGLAGLGGPGKGGRSLARRGGPGPPQVSQNLQGLW